MHSSTTSLTPVVTDVLTATTATRSLYQIPGKMGEWVQGVIDGQALLVTAVFSSSPFQATVQAMPASRREPKGVFQRAGDGLTTKAQRMMDLRFPIWNTTEPLNVQIWNPVGVGKGMGSSSVDMVGAALASARLLGQEVDDLELYRLMCQVERSDFLTRPDSLVVTNPESGDAQVAGAVPLLYMVFWDDAPTGTVDTAAVAGLDIKRAHYAGAYRDILAGVLSGDTQDFAAATTLSAVLNDRWLKKESLPTAMQLARTAGGGVVVAHTGTFIGVACADYEAAKWVMKQVWKMKARPFLGQCGVMPKIQFN